MATFGKTDKEVPLNHCSDGKISPAEFEIYKKTLSDCNIRFPTLKFVKQKLTDLETAYARKESLTEAELDRKMAMMRAGHSKHESYMKERLTKKRDDAAARGDDAAVHRYNMDLTNYGIALPTNPKTTKKTQNQQERLAELNRQNRKENAEIVRKALLNERRIIKDARNEAIAKARQRDAEAELAAKNKNLGIPDDLFGDGGSDISRAGTPGAVSANGTNTPKKGGSRAGTPGLQPKKSVSGLRVKNMDDEIIGAMDLGIEIDI